MRSVGSGIPMKGFLARAKQSVGGGPWGARGPASPAIVRGYRGAGKDPVLLATSGSSSVVMAPNGPAKTVAV